jgi:hypothetical protein
VTSPPDASVRCLLQLMGSREVNQIPIVEAERILGAVGDPAACFRRRGLAARIARMPNQRPARASVKPDHSVNVGPTSRPGHPIWATPSFEVIPLDCEITAYAPDGDSPLF